MIKIQEKPLSVNEAWQGRRFKTPKYKQWEELLLYTLPKLKSIKEQQIFIYLEYGVSSKNADIDNPNKPTIDVLQKKYNFNDRYIVQLHNKKVLTPKGKEYFCFQFFDNKSDFLKFLVDNV